MKSEPLTYSWESNSYRIGQRELEVGNCFEIEVNGRWFNVRLERNSRGMYLVGLPQKPYACNYEGRLCRF